MKMTVSMSLMVIDSFRVPVSSHISCGHLYLHWTHICVASQIAFAVSFLSLSAPHLYQVTPSLPGTGEMSLCTEWALTGHVAATDWMVRLEVQGSKLQWPEPWPVGHGRERQPGT